MTIENIPEKWPSPRESASRTERASRLNVKPPKDTGFTRFMQRKCSALLLYLRGLDQMSPISVAADPRQAVRRPGGAPCLQLYLLLLFASVVIVPRGTARAAVSDSFTLNADLSGGDIVCAAGVTKPLAIGTQMYIPAAGSWQAAWLSTFYVTFGNVPPTSLQFIFLVYNSATLKEIVKYNVEPALFQASTTKEFSFSVGTHGNDGNGSGVNSASPFYMTVEYSCLSQGQTVTVKGNSHILQIAWPE